MTSDALAKQAAKIADDHKGIDIAVLDLRKLTSFTDFFVIASGASDRQVRSLSQSIRDEIKQRDGISPIGAEGMDTGEWALVDYGDVVIHIFHKDVRDHYQLEKLWSDAKPAKLKSKSKSKTPHKKKKTVSRPRKK